MKTYTLEVKKRDLSSSVRILRREGQIPAVCYGQGQTATTVMIDYQPFRKIFMDAGYSQLIDLRIEGTEARKVLIHDLQKNPLTGKIEHVDFLSVDLKKQITTEVPIHIVGEAPAVKDLGGILNMVKHHLNVKCLPLEIPHDIEIDVSGLAEFSSAIHVSEVKVPEGVVLQDNPEDVVVIVNAPRVEEEAPPAAEGEVAAEGAAAEGAAAEGGEKAEGADGKKEGA